VFGLLNRLCSHSPREERNLPEVATFAVATPVFNGRAFLDETIFSVVTQAGPFKIRYHVQDGGSTDGTLDLLRRWSDRLSGDFPVLCAGVEFSHASELDTGLYDAINKAFARCGPGDVMSWMNSDDRYEPGAFASVEQIFHKFGDVRWLGGRPVLLSESGAQGQLVDLRGFPRPAIAAGIFDGRFAPFFLQQEGMFWRSELWHKTGGLNSRLRLAGDFDLWRRFARHSDFVMADALLGCFRVREGQLSATIESYRQEIDALLTPAECAARLKVAELFRVASTPDRVRAEGFQARFAENRVFAGGWHIVKRP
jgi:glycosyltransferase involved in cell wall biosynthesis